MGFGRVGRRGGFGRLGADFLRGGSIIAPPPPWTPAATSTALWLDAADASTFTFSSGSSVSQWSDKSGLGRNFSQGTVSSQPTRNVGVLNGLPGVTFNLQYLLAASASQVISNSFNLFVVASNDATRTDNNGMFVFYGPSTPDFSSPTTGVLMERMNSGGGGSGSYDCYMNGSGFAANSGAGVAGLGGKLLASELTSSQVLQFRVNGALSATTGAAVPGANITALNMMIGGRVVAGGAPNVATYGYSGTLHEIILIGPYPATQLRQSFEGYLAWKWGLQASLPAAHPYRNAAP